MPRPIRYECKRNDTLPVLGIDVLNSDGVAYDFSDATGAEFFMYSDTADRTVKVDGATATITSPGTQGQLQYTFDEVGTDTAGEYLGEFEVTFATGDKASFPVQGYIHITIEEDLNEA